MTEKEILKGKNNYKKLYAERTKAMSIQEKIIELESNPAVMEYLRLIEEKNNLIKPEENIAHLAFDQVAQNTMMHDYIYFYIGCSIENGKKFYHYYNLETLTVYTFDESEYKVFEDRFTVLFPFPDLDRNILVSDGMYLDAFEEIRNNYFTDLTSSPKEECIKQLKLQYRNSGKDI